MDSLHSHSVRRLYEPDLPLLRGHLTRLDVQTRYDRFGLHVSDAYLGDYAELCFKSDTITYGYFEDGVIRGAAELHLLPWSKTIARRNAEAAFSVERPWRRRGIGTDLMRQIVLVARNRRVEALTIFCRRHNEAMLKLARKFETDLVFEMSEVTGRLVSRAPSALSVGREVFANLLDLGSAMLDFQSRIIRAALPPAAR
jgi:GNAT superfamily N-acetyltransferase